MMRLNTVIFLVLTAVSFVVVKGNDLITRTSVSDHVVSVNAEISQEPETDNQLLEELMEVSMVQTSTTITSAASLDEEETVVPAQVDSLLPLFSQSLLAKYDGQDPSLPIYLAFEGNVYDVTEGRKFYQPGGAYHFLAGTDGTFLLKTFGGDIIKTKYPIVGLYIE